MKVAQKIALGLLTVVAFVIITAIAVNFDQSNLKGSRFIEFAVARK